MATVAGISGQNQVFEPHDHGGCVSSALSEAEAICKDRGVRLTDIRRRVLEMIWAGHKAVKAYDLISRFDADGSTKPPTIYRALDFLQEQGLVHKIQTLNAYVGCAEQVGHGVCHFFICESCGNVSEIPSKTLANTVKSDADELGFKVSSQTVEITGQCQQCRT